jgi:alpha-L-arabinofuranosidase
MYTNMLEKYMVPVSLTCSNLTYENQQTPVLDAVLTSDKEGKRFVYAIVNKNPDNSTSLTIDFATMNKKAPKKLNGWVLSGRSADDYNDRGDEHVKPEQHTFRVSNGSVTIPPHTVAFITIE